jgi:hypothetical protein
LKFEFFEVSKRGLQVAQELKAFFGQFAINTKQQGSISRTG